MKLLDRTLRNYLLYSAVVMLISTPVFYGVIQQIFVDDVNEDLLLRKATIQQQIARFTDRRMLLTWRDLEGNTTLQAVNGRTPKSDTIYDVVYQQPLIPPYAEAETFRELSARITYRGQSIHLLTRISLVEKEDLLWAVVLVQAGLSTLLLVGLLFLTRRTARKLWHPFYSTLTELRLYRVEQNGPLALLPSPVTEFAELNQALNELTRRSHQTFLDQKEFTENAAHEMQTPVAIFQTKLERLVQTQPLSEEQSSLISALSGITTRLSRLNKSLLSLVRIDNQSTINPEPVRLTNVLTSLIDQSIETVIAKQIDLTRVGFEDSPTLQTNRTLLDTLFSNLLSNAIRYTPKNGRITINVQPQSVAIANTGDPLTITTTQLFARFAKGEAQTGGVGLGLAIAKKIADTCGYSLTYQYANGQHRFVLWFG